MNDTENLKVRFWNPVDSFWETVENGGGSNDERWKKCISARYGLMSFSGIWEDFEFHNEWNEPTEEKKREL